jgi:hypothetical protein
VNLISFRVTSPVHFCTGELAGNRLEKSFSTRNPSGTARNRVTSFEKDFAKVYISFNGNKNKVI